MYERNIEWRMIKDLSCDERSRNGGPLCWGSNLRRVPGHSGAFSGGADVGTGPLIMYLGGPSIRNMLALSEQSAALTLTLVGTDRSWLDAASAW